MIDMNAIIGARTTTKDSKNQNTKTFCNAKTLDDLKINKF